MGLSRFTGLRQERPEGPCLLLRKRKRSQAIGRQEWDETINADSGIFATCTFKPNNPDLAACHEPSPKLHLSYCGEHSASELCAAKSAIANHLVEAAYGEHQPRYRKGDLDGFLNSRTVEAAGASSKAGK